MLCFVSFETVVRWNNCSLFSYLHQTFSLPFADSFKLQGDSSTRLQNPLRSVRSLSSQKENNFFSTTSKSSLNNADERLLTLKYCKVEVKATLWYIIGLSSLMTFSNTFALLLFPNELRLPLYLFITVLPVDGALTVNWAINYLFQLVTATFSTIFFLAYLPLTMLFMNHSCWKIEIVSLAIKNLNDLINNLQPNQKHLCEDLLIRISEKICKVIEYQRNAIELLKYIFLAEFASLTAIFCMCVKAISATLEESKNPLTAVLINLWQLFVYCWMGSRIKSFVESLTIAMYEVNWEFLSTKQQKDWLLMLAICQNLRGYHGIFQHVDLETLKNVRLFKFFSKNLYCRCELQA